VQPVIQAKPAKLAKQVLLVQLAQLVKPAPLDKLVKQAKQV
jgi:hypothetical protein